MDVHANIDVSLDIIAFATPFVWDLGHFSRLSFSSGICGGIF
jgi:hypothetical protein